MLNHRLCKMARLISSQQIWDFLRVTKDIKSPKQQDLWNLTKILRCIFLEGPLTIPNRVEQPTWVLVSFTLESMHHVDEFRWVGFWLRDQVIITILNHVWCWNGHMAVCLNKLYARFEGLNLGHVTIVRDMTSKCANPAPSFVQPNVFIHKCCQTLLEIWPVPPGLCISQVSDLQGNQQTQNACDSWQQTTFDSIVKQTTDQWLSFHNCNANITLAHQHPINKVIL